MSQRPINSVRSRVQKRSHECFADAAESIDAGTATSERLAQITMNVNTIRLLAGRPTECAGGGRPALEKKAIEGRMVNDIAGSPEMGD